MLKNGALILKKNIYIRRVCFRQLVKTVLNVMMKANIYFSQGEIHFGFDETLYFSMGSRDLAIRLPSRLPPTKINSHKRS